MDECPFCGHAIDAVTARLGGTCRTCFGEVPGEEAATDPGATPTPARPRSRELTLAVAATSAIVLGISLVILVAVGHRLASEPSGPRDVLDFDAWPMPEVVAITDEATSAEDPPELPDADAETPAPAPPRVRTPESLVPTELVAPEDLSAGLRGGTEARADPARRRRATRPDRITRRSPTPRASAELTTGVGAVDLSVGGGTVQRDDNVVLDDPLAIRMMIGERLRRGIAELRGCYDRRLKQRPDLAGRWRLTFTVSRDGRATDAALDGLDAADEALEGCLREHVVRRWAFARVAEPTEVSKTLSFHVGR